MNVRIGKLLAIWGFIYCNRAVMRSFNKNKRVVHRSYKGLYSKKSRGFEVRHAQSRSYCLCITTDNTFEEKTASEQLQHAIAALWWNPLPSWPTDDGQRH